MKQVLNIAVGIAVWAVLAISAAQPASAALFCRPFPGPADPIVCSSVTLPIEERLNREQLVIDTLNHKSRWTFLEGERAEESDDWFFNGKNIRACGGCLARNTQNLSRLRKLKGQ